ncbi:MAG TPA: hypothetical protein VJ418_28805 [Streptosporangiaceae bacterium]|nr:hypothetical protein [Streptosporangiaceae bacterium]
MPNETWYQFHAKDVPTTEYLVTMIMRVPEAIPDEPVKDILGRAETSGECTGSESLR